MGMEEDDDEKSRPMSELLKDFDFEAFERMRNLRSGYGEAKSMADRWGYIRQVWAEHMSEVLEAPQDRWVDPYWVNWEFSAAEHLAWCAIRGYGHVVLYPQVPVFNWFVDFGHPMKRVGLEIDGQQWHDPVKDAARDTKMWNECHWRIFRVPARELNDFETENTYRERLEWLAADGRADEQPSDTELNALARTLMMETGEGVLYAIGALYFGRNIGSPLNYFVRETLLRHRLAEFPL